MRRITRTLLEAAGSGLAGALTVTALNETLRHQRLRAPRLQRLGMRAARRGMRQAGMGWPSRRTQYGVGLGGDLLGNTAWYGLVRIGRYPRPVLRGVILGAVAGVSTVALGRQTLGGRRAVGLTPEVQAMTVAYYTAAGLVAGLVGRAFAEMRAMTPHPVRTTRRRVGGAWEDREAVVQTEEARL
jgi:hypothetical protein